MPQLDFATYVPQIIWLVITFTAMFLVMWKVCVPRIGGALEARQKKVEQNLERAAELKTEAEAAIAAYEKALADARATAHEEIVKVQADLKARQDAEEAKLSAALQARVKEGEGAIDKALKDALASLDAMATEVATAACERLIGEAPDAKAVEKAVTAAAKARSA
ncbi:MAG: F0F1 ATP synthase subunit B' [Rhodospirillales bacterium CG15_BIG_FIL_POST_REV_8_21_14_020_66_15]|nr:MAG: F0F1 ATP synthase subunit B' [Rhodospirillales bacterium CG15_BIG_FIL_POST_REV_8_21_14_020_66_15]